MGSAFTAITAGLLHDSQRWKYAGKLVVSLTGYFFKMLRICNSNILIIFISLTCCQDKLICIKELYSMFYIRCVMRKNIKPDMAPRDMTNAFVVRRFDILRKHAYDARHLKTS